MLTDSLTTHTLLDSDGHERNFLLPVYSSQWKVILDLISDDSSIPTVIALVSPTPKSYPLLCDLKKC